MSLLSFGYLVCGRCGQKFNVDNIGGFISGYCYCEKCYSLPLGKMCSKCIMYKDNKCLLSNKAVESADLCNNLYVKMNLIEKDVV